jgi:AbrB family looped-hinge helix DNA binding protein
MRKAMREFTASVTERGQVTLPVQVRRHLGISKRDKVSFVIEDGRVELRRPRFTIENVFASVEPLSRPEDWAARIREAKEERAERAVKKLRE